MQVPLILASNHVRANLPYGPQQLGDLAPRQDYVEIARRLEGELYGCDLFDTSWYHWVRQIEKCIKLDLVESAFAVRRFSKHNVVLSASEKTAIPLAALLSMTNRKIPHVVIAHKLSSGLKSYLFRVWQLHKAFFHVICVCRAQADYAINQLGLPESTVDFVYDKVDHCFFRPLKIGNGDYILAVGREQRDYETLLRATSSLGVKLVIVASSRWSTNRLVRVKGTEATILSHIPYQELRELYAGARLIVIPLYDVDYAAGVNTVLEAMAMAKPIIVSRSRGIIDYVAQGQTGVYVAPGDVEELRDAILSLFGKHKELNRLGTNARQAVEERMNLDIYVNRVVHIVQQAVPALELRRYERRA